MVYSRTIIGKSITAGMLEARKDTDGLLRRLFPNEHLFECVVGQDDDSSTVLLPRVPQKGTQMMQLGSQPQVPIKSVLGRNGPRLNRSHDATKTGKGTRISRTDTNAVFRTIMPSAGSPQLDKRLQQVIRYHA